MTGPSAAATPPTAVQARTAPWRRSGANGGEDEAQRGRGEQRGAGRLDETEGDEHRDAGRGTAGRRGRGEHRDAEQEAVLAAVAVGQPSEEHEQGGVDDGVAVEHPGEVAESVGCAGHGDVGKRDIDDEQVEAGQHDAGADDREHDRPASVLAVLA